MLRRSVQNLSFPNRTTLLSYLAYLRQLFKRRPNISDSWNLFWPQKIKTVGLFHTEPAYCLLISETAVQTAANQFPLHNFASVLIFKFSQNFMNVCKHLLRINWVKLPFILDILISILILMLIFKFSQNFLLMMNICKHLLRINWVKIPSWWWIFANSGYIDININIDMDIQFSPKLPSWWWIFANIGSGLIG